MPPPRIAIPVPTSTDLDYNRRSWPQYAARRQRVRRQNQSKSHSSTRLPPPPAHRRLPGHPLPGSGADVNPQKYGQDPDPETDPADPARENVDELLLQDAHNMRKPILAICFGTQMLNVWRGGTLVQHLTPMPVNHRPAPP